MSEWNINNYIPDLEKVSAWAARNPRHAAEVVMPLSGSYAGPAVLKEVGKAWAESNPMEGLKFASTLAPGARTSLGGEIIARWAERDLAAAVAYAEKQPDAMKIAFAKGLSRLGERAIPQPRSRGLNKISRVLCATKLSEIS
jgi:hypothetical protein